MVMYSQKAKYHRPILPVVVLEMQQRERQAVYSSLYGCCDYVLQI